jgi:hypothetical protein
MKLPSRAPAASQSEDSIIKHDQPAGSRRKNFIWPMHRNPGLKTQGPIALIAGFLALALVLPARMAMSEELGRLFFSPGQRQELERRRSLNIQATVITREDLVNATGVVTRSSGKSTIWLNGRPQDDVRKGQEPSRITVELGDGQPPVSLKVGETLEMGKGQSKDGLNGGTVSVNRRRP